MPPLAAPTGTGGSPSQHSDLSCELPDQLQEFLGPFGPEVSQRVSAKTGVSEGLSHGLSPGPFGTRSSGVSKKLEASRECPLNVEKVSRTLQGHSRDMFGHFGARVLKDPGKEVFRRGLLQECTPLLAVAL